MEVVTRRRFRPKWVTGLRPRLEAILNGGAGRGSLLGRGRIVSDMLEVTELILVQEPKEREIRVKGKEVEFIYPLRGNESFDEIYYPLVRMLSNL
ncbi:hypothetical protein [Thermococcus celer]|uniref:Uncharacterized protein n=1 Tax=Thermococcus celer Vu 13 = JCM 8558 TaxID=1293037 RepID=A0A218P3X3_THECE|nr:hypothetical protein [Thermococcus celer]ASI99627.1 hypothetical protein A3L02_08685 [Thermococcus celer Vu 13 = JCM 8558]